jgi:hypothetical protein
MMAPNLPVPHRGDHAIQNVTFALEWAGELDEALKAELKSYLELSAGWDGPESKAPTDGAVASALAFVNLLPAGIPLPKPMLSINGEVGLYWDIGNIYADVSFEDGDEFSIFIRDRSAEDQEGFYELKLSNTQPENLKAILASLA